MNDTVLMNKLLETAASLGWKIETFESDPSETLTELLKPSPLGIEYALYLKAQDMSTPESFLHFVRTQAFEFNLNSFMLELSTWITFDENQTVGAHIDDCFAVQQSVSALAQALQTAYDSYKKASSLPVITLKATDGTHLQLCHDPEKCCTVVTAANSDGSTKHRHQMDDCEFIHLLKAQFS